MTYHITICHLDDLADIVISSRGVMRLLIIMSSGWHTLPFLSHPDEIANFDFPQHAVALQRLRTFVLNLEAKPAVPELTTRDNGHRWWSLLLWHVLKEHRKHHILNYLLLDFKSRWYQAWLKQSKDSMRQLMKWVLQIPTHWFEYCAACQRWQFDEHIRYLDQ